MVCNAVQDSITYCIAASKNFMFQPNCDGKRRRKKTDNDLEVDKRWHLELKADTSRRFCSTLVRQVFCSTLVVDFQLHFNTQEVLHQKCNDYMSIEYTCRLSKKYV